MIYSHVVGSKEEYVLLQLIHSCAIGGEGADRSPIIDAVLRQGK